MNGIVEVVISLSEHSKVEVPRLCHETGCDEDTDKLLNCVNCPLSSTKLIKHNIKLFYGDNNE